MEIKSTKNVSTNGVKILVYGRAGTGKTTLIKTLPDPIIISAEGGLLSLSGTDFPVIEVSSFEDLREAYNYAKTCKHESIALDSISEIAEIILAHEKKNTKDPRMAYGTMQDQMNSITRAFRDIPKNIYFTAKQEKTQDDTGRVTFAPSMPGKKTGQDLPHFFDIVMCLRTRRDENGGIVRALQTGSDDYYEAKDRSGKLDFYELSDLGEIIRKVQA